MINIPLLFLGTILIFAIGFIAGFVVALLFIGFRAAMKIAQANRESLELVEEIEAIYSKNKRP